MLAHRVTPAPVGARYIVPFFVARSLALGSHNSLNWIFLLHLLHHAYLFQRLQILDHHLQRNRPILRRYRITNLLGISFPVREIQHLICVLFSRSPQSLVTQQLRRGHARCLCMFREIVKPKHRQRPFRLLLALELEQSHTFSWSWSPCPVSKHFYWQESLKC